MRRIDTIKKRLDAIGASGRDWSEVKIDWPSRADSAAHILTSLVGTSTLVPVKGGRLALGTWQGIFLCEFDGPRTRELWLTPVKEAT